MAVSLLSGRGAPIPGSERGGPYVRRPVTRPRSGGAAPPPAAAGSWIRSNPYSTTPFYNPIQNSAVFQGNQPWNTQWTRPQGGNYGDLIGGDYEVQFAESDMAAQMARARAAFRKGINQGLIDLGVVDQAKLGGLGKYIDKDTITKAAQNKYSTMSQVAEQEFRRRQTSEATRAAQGILTSGQTVKDAEDIIAGAEGQRYTALRDFLGSGEEGLMGLSNLESDLAWRLAQARAAAAARAAGTYPGWGDPGGYSGSSGGTLRGGARSFIPSGTQWPSGGNAPAAAPYRSPSIALPRSVPQRNTWLTNRLRSGRM